MTTTKALADALRLAREWFSHEDAGKGPHAFEVINAADSALAQYDAQAADAVSAGPGWMPIETAPKDGTLIVLGARNGVWLGKYCPVYPSGYRPENPWSSMLMNHDHMAERHTRPTHWQPLPSPPSAMRAARSAK